MSAQSQLRPNLPGSSPTSTPEISGDVEVPRPLAMLAPADLARMAEGYDEEDWFEFLDQMDEVYRRRRRREAKPDHPAGTDRRSMADWIARRHLFVDRSLQQIHFLPTDSPPDEIHLIEVNDRLPGNGEPSINPIEFTVDTVENPFRVFVADVNSDELEAIMNGRMTMPPGWKWDKNEAICYLRRRQS